MDFIVARVIAGFFELDEFGANLSTRDRRIRLGKRQGRGGQRSSNDNSLDSDFMMTYLEILFLSRYEHPCS